LKIKTTFLTATLIAMLFLGFASVFTVKATNGAEVFVDPKDNIFPPPSLNVGDTFTVNVTLANITGLMGLQFKLQWDSALLHGVSMVENLFETVTPSGENPGNIWQLSHVVSAGYAEYAYTFKNGSRAIDLGYAPFDINLAEGYPEGKLAVAIITLEVMKKPSMVEGFVECDLAITISKPGGVGGVPITHTVEDGYYKLNWSVPTSVPYYSVESYEATSLGEVFNVSVMINDLDSAWEAVGFEFKLGFNSTILEVLNIYEDPWLNDTFGQPPNIGTLFLSLIGADNVQVGNVVLPDGNGTWHTPFPGTSIPGSGVLALIEFNATYQDMFPEVASCVLNLFDTKIGDWMADPVNQTAPQDGVYSIRPRVLGRMIDIFTQYPNPYGGQGLHNPSDMFWPQKPVTINAVVTYNEWPEQQKDVAFQLIDPYGDTWAVLYARTGEDGLASVIFTLPWPCDDPEYWLGEWTITGTVDIACEIVNDTLTFHYDYLVHIIKVTTDSREYAHCEYMNITIDFKSKRMRTMDIILTITVMDETGVPFGFVYVETAIGGAEYCHYKNFTEGVSIHVIKWARAGAASIIVGALNDWPFNGGGQISKPFTPVHVSILAE